MIMDTEKNHKLSDTDEFFSCESDLEDDDNQLSMDAAHTKQPGKLHKHITSDDIALIDTNLALYEKVSLIYLLYDDPMIALRHILLLLQNPQNKVVDEWYCHAKKSKNCQNKLLEALTIIQNYEILIKIGFAKEDMIWRYLPLREVSLELNLVRKNCYRLCEDFTASERDRFLQYVEKDFESNDMQYIKSVNPAEYLEIYFLYFETVTYISLKDVSKLAKVFKQMNLINLHDKFEKLHEKICQLSSYSVDKIPDRRSTSTPNEITVSSDLPINNLETSDFAYNLNSERPGLLLIINNENFYAECWNEYSQMWVKVDSKLKTRNGTGVDKTRLQTIFTKLGFYVVTDDNNTHSKMLEELKTVKEDVYKLKYSSLFVAILSHGDQGIVYGVNSIPLQILEIKRIICGTKLRGIPKVLLLQCCQGNELQELINDNEELEVDSRKIILPKTTDLLTFQATILGYSALRDPTCGTWFIQTFCDMVEKYPKYDLQEICTRVIAEVSSKEWNGKCMVPQVETTFTKKLYLKNKK